MFFMRDWMPRLRYNREMGCEQLHPTLMRLRELETLERVVAGSKLSVMVGDKGLTENVLKIV